MCSSGGKLQITLEEPATEANFDENSYLRANPDVVAAVKAGAFPSGLAHFREYGCREQRRIRFVFDLDALRRRKLATLMDRLDLNRPHIRKGAKFDFLTDDLRQQTGIIDTEAVSSNAYDEDVQQIIRECPNGLVLDCGAGRRPVYYDNVVNYEIVDYDTTDVIGVGESLPFKDNSFDAVISVAVLEHVRDPFSCAEEIVRVLKPGGKLFCVVPFLQPEHGYPHHYFNMAPQGLRALFERSLNIDNHKVVPAVLPVWTLRWIVQSWASGLTGRAREDFLEVRLRDLTLPAHSSDVLRVNWVAQLPERKNFELACATVLFAHKPTMAATAHWRTASEGFDRPRAAAPSPSGPLVTHTEELALLRRELDGLRQALSAMHSSISWLITQPMRALRALLR
jgi:SAM-dependent methyltransferase